MYGLRVFGGEPDKLLFTLYRIEISSGGLNKQLHILYVNGYESVI